MRKLTCDPTSHPNRPTGDDGDFALKSSVIELFDHLSRIGDGTLESIEVKYGMPFKLVVEQAA